MIRYEQVRFKVLRRGGDYAFLYATSDPILSCKSDGEIKLSLRGNFRADAYNANGRVVDVDWLADEIKPVLILDGKESSLGVLSLSTVTVEKSSTDEGVSLEAYDRCWIVKDTKIEDILHLSRGSRYIDVIEQRLTASGITAIIKTPSSAVLAEDREDWKVGTSNLTIANDLLKEINYKQVYFNPDGVAILEPKAIPNAANMKHILSTKKQEVRDPKTLDIIPMSLQISSETDIYNAPNVFVCTCSNPDKSQIMIARAENANPKSPLSILRRGRRIVDFENVSNIASQAELQNYVDQKRNRSMITGEVITCETLLYPGFGVEDVTAIQTDTLNDLCVETEWEMELRVGGKMKHKLERVVINLD